MTSNTDEEAMSKALETLFTSLLESSGLQELQELQELQDSKSASDLDENDKKLIYAETYNDLKKAMNVSIDSKQFTNLEKAFPSANSVLKHKLPGLFEIIDTISIKNIIYSNPEMVNKLLNDVLFSGLTKIDKKLQGLYNSTGKSDGKDSAYIPLQITYNADYKSFDVHYPDFLDDAFESIKRKIEKHEDYKTIVSIKQVNALGENITTGQKEEGYEEGYNTDVVASAAVAVAAAVAAAVVQAQPTAYEEEDEYMSPRQNTVLTEAEVLEAKKKATADVEAANERYQVAFDILNRVRAEAAQEHERAASPPTLRVAASPTTLHVDTPSSSLQPARAMEEAMAKPRQTIPGSELVRVPGSTATDKTAVTQPVPPTLPATVFGSTAVTPLAQQTRYSKQPATARAAPTVDTWPNLSWAGAATTRTEPPPKQKAQQTPSAPPRRQGVNRRGMLNAIDEEQTAEQMPNGMPVASRQMPAARHLPPPRSNGWPTKKEAVGMKPVSSEETRDGQGAEAATPPQSEVPDKANLFQSVLVLGMQSAREVFNGLTDRAASIFTPAISQKKQKAIDDDNEAKAVADQRRRAAKPKWFRTIFNFDETNDWDATFDNFSMKDDCLLCNIATQDNYKKQFVGLFECLSLAELEAKLNIDEIILKKGLSFNHIIDDVKQLHYNPANTGAVFQAASQFNCLEMYNEYFKPEHGVAIYELDPAQGPACALACPAALVYRNYLVKHKDNRVQSNDTKEVNVKTGQEYVQIDNLKKLGTVVENYSAAEPDGVYWTMENGYAFLKSKAKLVELNEKLNEPKVAKSAMDALCVGVHWETSVNPFRVSNPHNVCQVYASALPIAYTNPRFILADTEEAAESEWEPFSRLILKASYEATLAVAAKKSLDNKSTRIKCYLTLLGVGAFKNKKEWIEDAITTAIAKYEDWPIDVILVHSSEEERDTYGWPTKIPPIEVEAVGVKLESESELKSESETETPRRRQGIALPLKSASEESVSTPALTTPALTTPTLTAPDSCPIENNGTTCWVNSAIQLLWNIDGVRDFLINSTIEDLDKLFELRNGQDEVPVLKDINTIYNTAIKETETEIAKGREIEKGRAIIEKLKTAKNKALSEVTNIFAPSKNRPNPETIIYTIKALRKLFLEIKNRNGSNEAIDIQQIKFKRQEAESDNESITVSQQLHDWYSSVDSLHPLESNPQRYYTSQASQLFLDILGNLFIDYMNIEIFNMCKSYAEFTSTQSICSNESTLPKKPDLHIQVNPMLLLNMGEFMEYDTSISGIINKLQEESDFHQDVANYHTQPGHACYQEGVDDARIIKKIATFTNFDESTSLIINTSRISNTAENKTAQIKVNTSVVPDKTLQFNKKKYTLQGCILHEGTGTKSGHYVYIIYDANGEPKEIINDGHKFNQHSKADQTGNYGKEMFDNYINQIFRNGTVFLYKNLAKMQEIAVTAVTIAKPFIEHAIERVNRLRFQLLKPEVNVLIAGSNGKHNLGTGLAKLQWLQHYVKKDYPINVIISAQRLFVEKLDELFKELESQYPHRVSYNENVTKAKADVNNIVVWGANYLNCYGDINEKIDGDGQARDMVSHGAGVFGIITTPLAGEPPGIMKGFGTGADESITTAGLTQTDKPSRGIQQTEELPRYGSRTDRSSRDIQQTDKPSRYRSRTARTIEGASAALSSLIERRKAIPELHAESQVESQLKSQVESKPLNISDFGILLAPVSSTNPITAYTQRQTILRNTLELFAKNRKKYADLAERNVERWSKSTDKMEPTSCILTVSEEDWGTKAQEVTKKYGTKFACLNMANSNNPGGGYTAGAAAQEENMFRRTDCHFSLTYPDIIDEVYRKYTPEMIKLIEGKAKTSFLDSTIKVDGKNVVYIDKTQQRICIRGEEVYTEDEKGVVTINGYQELKEDEIFPFYEMRSAALRIKDSMLFNEEEMKQRIHAQIDTLIKKEIKHVVLGAFGCGAFRNPPERIACIYREKLKTELAEDKDCFKVIEFPIFYAGNGQNNYEIFRKAFEETAITDKNGKTVTSWMNNTTDFKVKHIVTIDDTINYKKPQDYGGDSTSVMVATDEVLTGQDFNNPDKERKRIYIMKQTLEYFAKYKSKAFEEAKDNFAKWQADAQANPAKPAKVIVENIDWGEATLKYTIEYGKIFACLNMANGAVPGGGYIKGMGAQEENMFRRTNCHFTIKAATLDDNQKSNPGEWDKRLYRKDKTDLLKGEYGYVYFDWEYPRICIKGPEQNNADLGYSPLFEEIFPFYELRCAALDRRIVTVDKKIKNTDPMTQEDKATMRKRINAQLETLIVHGAKYVILGAFGCGIFCNEPQIIAAMYREAIADRAQHFEVIVFAILPDYSNANKVPNINFDTFNDIFTNHPLTIGAASYESNLAATIAANELDAALAASLVSVDKDKTSTSTSTSIDYRTPDAYGQNISNSHITVSLTSNSGYHLTLEEIRMVILLDTIRKFQNDYQSYLKSARENLARWVSEAKDIDGDKLVAIANLDWGDAALQYTRQYGTTFACLNMASAIYPGGSYNLGGSGQEENMFRRTNCHFAVNREHLRQIPEEELTDIENSAAYNRAYWKYNLNQKALIEGKNDVVYLDKANPRICIKGAETVSDDLGYSVLANNEIFSFYEMRCAPLDRRDPLPPMRDMTQDTEEIKKRIEAIFDTLITAEIKYVILGDFGCGKLKNNPFTIANIYKEVIAAKSKHFEKIVITIPDAEYNKTILDAFTIVFDDKNNKFATDGRLKLNDTRSELKKDQDKRQEIAEEFLMLARDRINELRNILKERPTAKVTIACMDDIGNMLGFASGSSASPWLIKYKDPKNQKDDTDPIGEPARRYFRDELRKLFNSLKDESDHKGQISYGDISKITPSLDHFVVWSAYSSNYETTPQKVENSEKIAGRTQASFLTPHKVGLFGIIGAPGEPV